MIHILWLASPFIAGAALIVQIVFLVCKVLAPADGWLWVCAPLVILIPSMVAAILLLQEFAGLARL